MRRLLLLSAIVFCMESYAGDYSYLTFETIDGSKVSVEAAGLDIALSGTTLTAGGHDFKVENLSKMYFSTENISGGIEKISVETDMEWTAVYDLNGRKVAKEQMTKGVYLVTSKGTSYKIVVR